MRFLLLFLSLTLVAQAADPLPLKPGPNAHVVLIGNTLIEQMQNHAWFEGMLVRRFAAEKPVIRTLAWPGDEITVQPRPEDYGDIHQHLTDAKADIIIAGYGFNESFRGQGGLQDFESNLHIFIASLRSHRYNERSAPQIVLVSPIAHEDLHDPNLPDGRANNERIALYTAAMKRVAAADGVGFIDAFAPTSDLMRSQAKKTPLTFNGVHLTDEGHRQFAEVLYTGLIGETPGEVPANLKKTLEDKDRQFLRSYRPLNGFYITGGRREPYGVVNFPGELKKLAEMTGNRERRAWTIARGNPVPDKIDDGNTTPLPAITGDRPVNEWLKPEDERAAFRMDPRFEVNLFASEERFPELAKPIQMRWDTRGRLWVSCSTTYPQVTPGREPDDKIIILEDTDGDGKADKCSVFATGLHIPLSFEFGDGGVYCSEQPGLTFLKDLDGDGKADLHKLVLTGFGTEDSHHALHDFTWSPDGDLFFRESIFHHSSVETPYGPVRTRDSSFFRFQPRTQKLIAFGSYYSTNPWGLTFDDWGWHLGSHPVFASAVHALNPPYPAQHVPAGEYFPAYSGTCGQDFIYSRHFPDELQGCFARVRYKPTNTVELHQWVEKDTHYEEKLIGHLWQSTNLSFIPVDVRFGPRGDLYICDWYNPVKGHMQYSLRDTRRDKTSGRIWRVTAKGRALDDAPEIAGQPVAKLLDLLKRPEYRIRYTARIELRERDRTEVKTALDSWVATLDENDPRVLHHQTEAMWLYHSLGKPDNELLAKLLQAGDHQARAAATRELRWPHPGLANTAALLRERANDESGLVRLEAAIAASYLQSVEAADAALDLLKHPMDSYLTFALRSSLDALKPVWQTTDFASKHPQLAKFYIDSEPKKKKVKKEAPDPFDKLNPTIVKIGTVNERMQFTVTTFNVKAGSPVKLVFDNPDATPHNLLIVQPGAADEIGFAAIEMAKQPEALVSLNFTPNSPKILQATKMIKQGESDTLRFTAPRQPGSYPYICSFPGHYLVMKGVMVVE